MDISLLKYLFLVFIPEANYDQGNIRHVIVSSIALKLHLPVP